MFFASLLVFCSLKVFSELNFYEGTTLIRELNCLWLRAMPPFKIKTEWLYENCFSFKRSCFLEVYVFSKTWWRKHNNLCFELSMAEGDALSKFRLEWSYENCLNLELSCSPKIYAFFKTLWRQDHSLWLEFSMAEGNDLVQV